jgi:hypothetical protein
MVQQLAPDLGMTGVPQPPRHVLYDALQEIDFLAQRDHGGLYSRQTPNGWRN